MTVLAKMSAVHGDGRQRAVGRARVGFAYRRAATGLADLEQGGALRVLFPRPEPGACPTAVLANIGGGIAGGDRLDIAVEWGEGAEAVVTTQAAEKVYRASDAVAQFATTLTIGAGSVARWLPQETILFDGARLERSLDVAMAADAELLACESVVFGRTARGERVQTGRLRDRWRVRRDGRLVFADTLELDGALAKQLDRRAVAAGGVAVATVLFVAPDAEARLEALRAVLETAESEAGASAFDGLLTARLVGQTAAALRRDLVAVLTHLGRRPLPRVFAF